MNNSASSEDSELDTNVFSLAGKLWKSSIAWIDDLGELAALETQQAGRGLAYMLACAVTAALLIVTAWFAALAALVLWIVYLGVPWPWALILAALLSIGGATGLFFVLVDLSSDLLFKATRRQLHARASQARQ
jgi:uncharacterized membrane protein YqjE